MSSAKEGLMKRKTVVLLFTFAGAALMAFALPTPTVAGDTPQTASNPRWEYRALTMSEVLSQAPKDLKGTLTKALNVLGQRGWQLVFIGDVFPHRQAAKELITNVTFIFMRRVSVGKRYEPDPLPPTEDSPPMAPANAPLIQQFPESRQLSRFDGLRLAEIVILSILAGAGIVCGANVIWRRTKRCSRPATREAVARDTLSPPA
jgi:hypothetical protein